MPLIGKTSGGWFDQLCQANNLERLGDTVSRSHLRRSITLTWNLSPLSLLTMN